MFPQSSSTQNKQTITARAHANIALIKYWGKRDTSLFLPTKSSLSISLDDLQTTTHVSFSQTQQDTIILNGKVVTNKTNHISSFLDTFRSLYNIHAHYTIETSNNFPTAAGLASSASGFAALAKSLDKLHNLNLSSKELSILARRGSGSASRSIESGFVLWHRGHKPDGSDSYAQKLFDRSHWPELAIVVLTLETNKKPVSSREAMQKTIATSPFYKTWVKNSEARIAPMIEAIRKKDIHTLGALAEKDSLEMHHCMQTATPSINFLTKRTKAAIAHVQNLRKPAQPGSAGTPCYCTIDAGPNVKVITLAPYKSIFRDLSHKIL